ncbi:unnamed protein product [Lathyrus oleraceus]|uniref:RING-type domain-containing protein n=1 Tax=Pisum sativum TaxID=3888 RepID=A0A9D4W8S5_PEA|nr:uncharacterized protein LOC127093013 [Pisum sativum]KAI5397157.1 hypothetical protein KIW84_063110 [Pisum sativum]
MSNRRRKTNLLLGQDNITSEESSMGEGSSESIHVPINYLEEIDDDVVECSPRAFAQAAANAGRTRRRIAIDWNLEDIIQIPILPPENIHIQNPIPIISTSVMQYREDITEPIGQNNANLEVNINEAAENDKKSSETNREVPEPNVEAVEPPKEAEPPKDPLLNCPICLEAFVEETSTMCGHIFCQSCIKTAITRQRKCPTCRRKHSCRGLRRVFLPSYS